MNIRFEDYSGFRHDKAAQLHRQLDLLIEKARQDLESLRTRIEHFPQHQIIFVVAGAPGIMIQHIYDEKLRSEIVEKLELLDYDEIFCC